MVRDWMFLVPDKCGAGDGHTLGLVRLDFMRLDYVVSLGQLEVSHITGLIS